MNLAPAIILIVVAVVVGYVLGIIDSRITASLRQKVEENKASAEAAAQQPAPDERRRPGEHTILRVSIDLALKLHLELDGSQQDEPAALTPEQRQRLIKLVTQLRPWMDGKTPEESAPLPVPAPQPEPAPMIMPLQQPAQNATPSKPAPRVDPMRGFRSLLNNDVKVPGQNKGPSIVSMIDEVLQAKLLGSPLLDKNIRLEEGALGEVNVMVGKQRYAGVEDVPDADIRAVIKAAISDWDKK